MIDDFSRPPERKPVKLSNLSEGSSDPLPGDNMPPAQSTPSDEPAFRTPEEISQTADDRFRLLRNDVSKELSEPKSTTAAQKGSDKLKSLIAWRPTKKQAIIIAAAFVVLVGGGTTLALTALKKPVPAVAKAAPVPKPKPAPAPKPITSPLTGLVVTAEQQAKPVTAVMIENSPDARPQSGLDQAGVVFEAIAEAGITRFMALYQETAPGTLGPVRSSRPYFLDWEMGFDAAYAHVGGSPDALQRIKDIGVKDLDQFYNSGAYHRISTRYAPHNMYTSIDALQSVETSKGWTKSSYTPLLRKEKETPIAAPTAKSINFAISGAYYNVHYDYDQPSNSYKRSEGGAVHVDNETKQQLSPKVVVALAMPYSLMDDGYHSMYQTTGSGKMFVFQDGGVTSGTWEKADPKTQFTFKDDAGKPLSLNPGQTWITALGDISNATYQP